ncbi:MAG: Mur ligase family protein, partial [Gemmatimonadaceae bacterium]
MGPHLSTYRDALAYLFARTTGTSKFGLERTVALLEALGRPDLRVPAFHVAGTNGKGSVCTSLETMLRARGLRTGKYSSPHLVDLSERFVVDGAAVSHDWVTEFITRWTPEVERIGATFFEATTAMAFQFFADSDVDVAVIETGLGGRLDSTNVVRPLVAGVTAIGIDHVEYLGTTRSEIAREKGGIFKPGIPAAIGDIDPEIVAVLRDAARDAGASTVLSVLHDTPPTDIRVDVHGTRFRLHIEGAVHDLHTPLLGTHQAWNTSLALLMLRAAGGPYWGG